MSQILRVGVIGCGAMGQGHLKVWESLEGASAVAVCDGDAKRAQEVGARHGARAYGDLQSLLEAGELDAVDICTPSGLHADQGMEAAKRNLHILCEKPLDLNLEKADALLEACEKRGLTLACAFQQRIFPAGRQVAQAISEGKLGRLISCSGYVKWWRSQEYYGSGGWRGTLALDGGALANQAIHTLDMLCWLAGGVAEVEYAHLETASHIMEAEDNALAVFRFENGARGVFEATTCASPDLCTRIEIVGTRGAVAFDNANVVRYGYDGEDRLEELEEGLKDVGGGRSNPMGISLQGHRAIAEDFVEAIRDRRKPLVSGRDARASLDALAKIYRKAAPDLRLGT